MRKKLISQIAMLLLMLAASSCSIVQTKPSLTWLLTLEIDPVTEDVVNQTIAVISARLDRVGLKSVKVERQANRILVSLPDVPDRARLKNIITSPGKLELLHVVSPPSPFPVATYKTKEDAVTSLGGTLPPNRQVLTYLPEQDFAEHTEGGTREQTKWVVVASPAVVTGNDLRTAEALQMRRDDYNILFSLKPSGAERFGAWTGANINQYLAVALNDEVKSIAFIKAQIFDQGEITGRFTKQSAEDLANILISGSLPAPVKIVSEVPIK